MDTFKKLDVVEYDTLNLKEATASAAITSNPRFNSYIAGSTSEVFDELGNLSLFLIE